MMFLLDTAEAQKQEQRLDQWAGFDPCSVLLSDDEGDGRFAGLLRQQERQLGHSAVTCLERTALGSPPAPPCGPLRACGAQRQLPQVNIIVIVATPPRRC